MVSKCWLILETTAVTLHWCLLELCKRPSLQKKLFEKVYEVLQGRDPTVHDIPKLKYVDALLKECLRLHPPVEILPREATAPFELNNIDFPKGTIFEIRIPHVHENSKYFYNPTEMIPERWLEENDLPFFSFAFGPRNCIGRKFAEVEMILILSCLIQRFSFEFKPDINQEEYFKKTVRITTTPINDHPLIYKKRVIQ